MRITFVSAGLCSTRHCLCGLVELFRARGSHFFQARMQKPLNVSKRVYYLFRGGGLFTHMIYFIGYQWKTPLKSLRIGRQNICSLAQSVWTEQTEQFVGSTKHVSQLLFGCVTPKCLSHAVLNSLMCTA